MNDFCAPPSQTGMAAGLLADTDCQAFNLVERGYAALSQPGGSVSAALTGLLVIAVALFGYRLLLGRGLLLADAVGLAIKIGIVLAIASSWASWQTLAYDSFARAPTRIASDLLTGMDAGDPVSGLQSALDGLENASVGYRTRAGIASPLVGGAAASAMTLYVSGMILTLSILGILVISRIVLALLLAIAPVMAGFILFDATRGMAAKWLSAMATVAFAPMFVLVLASVELAIVGPLITRLLAQQAGNHFDDGAVIPIGLITIIFGLAMIAAVRAGSRIASGIRLPRRAASPHAPDVIVPQVDALPAILAGRASSAAPPVSRSLERVARQEAGAAPTMTGASSLFRTRSSPAGANTRRDAPSSPDILVSRSRTAVLPHARRRSRSAARRDG